MNLVVVAAAIFDRLSGDTASGGLRHTGTPLVTGIFSYDAPETQAYPYIAFIFSGAENMDTLEKDVIKYTVDISVVSDKDAGLTAVSAILDRVYGNANESANVPTFGLHRHKLELGATTEWEASTMRRIDSIEAHDRDHYQFIERYEFLCTNNT